MTCQIYITICTYQPLQVPGPFDELFAVEFFGSSYCHRFTCTYLWDSFVLDCDVTIVWQDSEQWLSLLFIIAQGTSNYNNAVSNPFNVSSLSSLSTTTKPPFLYGFFPSPWRCTFWERLYSFLVFSIASHQRSRRRRRRPDFIPWSYPISNPNSWVFNNYNASSSCLYVSLFSLLDFIHSYKT